MEPGTNVNLKLICSSHHLRNVITPSIGYPLSIFKKILSYRYAFYDAVVDLTATIDFIVCNLG